MSRNGQISLISSQVFSVYIQFLDGHMSRNGQIPLISFQVGVNHM